MIIPHHLNIVLIGPMGVGKTTIGRLLAKKLGWPFFDSDREIERRTGASISLIFEIEKEQGFRKREREMIATLVKKKISSWPLGVAQYWIHATDSSWAKTA